MQPFKPIVEPTEQAASVLSGWAIAWAMTEVGVDPVPSVIVGALIWAFFRGSYRRRWLAYGGGRPDPGE